MMKTAKNRLKGLVYMLALLIRLQQLVIIRREVLIWIKWQLRALKLIVSGRVFKGGGRRTLHSSIVFGNKMLFEIFRACFVNMRDL